MDPTFLPRRKPHTKAIEVEGLRKSYGAVEAVRGLTFSVEEGEVLAVLGPNGAGKTTTLEILEGYRFRDGGRVRVLGTDPALGGAGLRQRIGIVLQECGITPYLTVAEVLRKHSEYYASPRRVEDAIALVGLEDKAGTRTKALSQGQLRRLDLALGLIGDPELLFLDEPTTGFDPSARRQAWEVVRNLRQLNKTVLLTTHYLDEAQALADRVVVIAAGEVVAEGPPGFLTGQLNVHIRFPLPAGVALDELPVTGVLEENQTVVIESDHPAKALQRLTTWAVLRGLELAGLSVTRPSLEDAYLAVLARRSDSREGTS